MKYLLLFVLGDHCRRRGRVRVSGEGIVPRSGREGEGGQCSRHRRAEGGRLHRPHRGDERVTLVKGEHRQDDQVIHPFISLIRTHGIYCVAFYTKYGGGEQTVN